MSKITKSVAAVLLALSCAGLAYAPNASAQTVPLTLTQQGRLLDNTGAPIDGVQLTFTFSLYTAAVGGTAVWSEQQSVTPDKGYFSAKLGDSTAFTATIFDGSKPTLYLGIKIGSDAEMAPRQELTSVPFAMLSLNALNATHATKADTATNATNATNATLATNATNAANATLAANATNADHATTAANVTSIAANIVSQNATGGSNNYAVVACPAGASITGGGCLQSGGSISAVGYQSGKGAGTGWICQCTGTSCTSVSATVYCAK